MIDGDSPIFLVCGPKGFMDNAREILSTLGVKRERILQESFGETKRSTESRPREARVVETAVFIRSQKVCQLSAEALSWIWRRKTACRFRTAAARAYAARGQLEF